MTQTNFLILMVDQMTGCLLDEAMLKHLHTLNITTDIYPADFG